MVAIHKRFIVSIHANSIEGKFIRKRVTILNQNSKIRENQKFNKAFTVTASHRCVSGENRAG